ncbi:MAG: hypothetical protein ABH854_03525 [Candidatus Diapherotrites archaeon]|nr:60S ribosomal protein L31 [Candidatus Micrarchaeota archaeon]MBU1939873.1 60S ribosomal protein L31 [Candidatus Micrarchaeota archaeon]
MKGEEAEYVVPFRKLFNQPVPYRARRAIRELKRFAVKHTRVEESEVLIAEEVNREVWKNSYNIPRRANVILRKKDGKIVVYLQGGKQLAEDKKREEKEKKAAEDKKKEKEAKDKGKSEVKSGAAEPKGEAHGSRADPSAQEESKRLAEKKIKEKAAEKADFKRKTGK